MVLERPRQAGPPWHYAGAIFTADARHETRAQVSADGSVTLLAEGADPALVEKARLLLRTAVKHAQSEDAEPPLRLIRWRAGT